MKQPLLIGIGGSHSSVGKTTIAVALLNHLTLEAQKYGNKRENNFYDANSALARLRSYRRWGAIKYTKTAFYSTIINDILILKQKYKDTRRFIDAGAMEVLWVQSPSKELHKILPEAIKRLSYLDAIIIEGNSAIEFLNPDIVIFISAGNKTAKTSARAIHRQADIVITADDKIQPPDSKLSSYCLHIDPFALDVKAVMKIIDYMEIVAIKELLQKKSEEGTLTCETARELADSLGMPYIELGKLADELKIKIKNCELGCF